MSVGVAVAVALVAPRSVVGDTVGVCVAGCTIVGPAVGLHRGSFCAGILGKGGLTVTMSVTIATMSARICAISAAIVSHRGRSPRVAFGEGAIADGAGVAGGLDVGGTGAGGGAGGGGTSGRIGGTGEGGRWGVGAPSFRSAARTAARFGRGWCAFLCLPGATVLPAPSCLGVRRPSRPHPDLRVAG